MTQRTLLAAAFCLLLSVAPALAQDAGKASDPVTGRWGGAGLTFLDLQYDGKSTVSGFVILHRPGRPDQRAAIKTGTFDAQTGELKLTGRADRDGKIVDYFVEGKIEKDEMTGESNLGGERKVFRFVREQA